MSETVLFALEAGLNGLTVGIMYSLVELGFVLIFKASGIFNFAQGVMALFAALTLVGVFLLRMVVLPMVLLLALWAAARRLLAG